jgi:methionine-S-sulfoxide reductase
MIMTQSKATFAAGCFWGVQEAFDGHEGVLSTKVGYSGGRTKDPTYERVCRGNTGHAESIEVVFDPDKVSYRELVRFFFEIHDPTTKDRQGPDIGSQYRSAIFYLDEEQKRIAGEVKGEIGKGRSRPVVTEITEAGPFYPAEEYHQKYIKKHGLASCHY